MTKFTRLKAGEKVVIREDAYNACLDAAEANVRRMGAKGTAAGGNGPALIVKVINESGYQLQAGHICWLDELESGKVVDQTRYEASTAPMMRAVFRWAVSTHNANQRFGVLLEPIPPGEIGRVCIRGVCAAYVKEVQGQAGEGQSEDVTARHGRYAVPLFDGGAPSPQTMLYRYQGRGPVEILHELGDDPALIDLSDDMVYDGFYLVDIQQESYCVTALWSSPTYTTTYDSTYYNIFLLPYGGEVGSQYISESGIADPNLAKEGFYKQFAGSSTPAITGLDANGIIENSIIRLPYEGMWEVDLSACGRIFLNADAPAVMIDPTGVVSYSLTMKNNSYSVAIVPVDAAGAEIVLYSSAYREARAYPPNPGLIGATTTLNWAGDLFGGELVSWTGLHNTVITTGPRVTNGSFSCRVRLHYMAGVRLGVRVRLMQDHPSLLGQNIPAHVLDVWGRLTARPAPVALQTSVGNTVIVGTAGTPNTYSYTLANTGTTAPASRTLNTYAWSVWCPDGTVETATGSSFTRNYSSHGAGEYVALLVATYTGGSSYGAEEHRFTLPNA